MSDYVRGLRAKVGRDLLYWPSIATLIRDEAGRILLVEHAESGIWTFPGGQMDPGEEPSVAARRETREEAGIDVEIVRLAGAYGGDPDFRMTYPNGDEVAWVTLLFEGRIVGGAPHPADDETSAVRWCSLEEALAMEISPSTRHMLAAVSAGRQFD